MFEFSPDQNAVVDHLRQWIVRQLQHRQDPWITVGGLAGTGKTTILSYLAKEFPRSAVAALCGKAAHVLRTKGIDASTIHSLIYVPKEDRDGQIRFEKRRHLENTNLVFIDEASMVNESLLRDLVSFHHPIVFIGDHGQLEPIGDSPNLMGDPVLRLEKIHRQAEGNPILQLAHQFREGSTPSYQDSDDRLSVRPKNCFFDSVVPEFQMICGFNKTRHAVNFKVRTIMGNAGHLLIPGEKIVILRNNPEYGIFNGQQLIVNRIVKNTHRIIRAEVEDEDGHRFQVACLKEQFGKDVIQDHREREIALADYGYCLTCHKAQGSEFDTVLVMDEVGQSWDAKRWRYTASTRAKEKLIYCL